MSEGTAFYRCMLCAKVVSPWDLRTVHCCRHCGGTKVKPTNLSWFEQLWQIIRHPLVWQWPRG